MELINKYKNEFIEVGDLEFNLIMFASRTFYYGDENGFSQEEFNSLREELYKPDLRLYRKSSSPIESNILLGSEVVNNFEEYKKYVIDVFEKYTKYNKEITYYPSYFWVRPLIYSKSQNLEINFSWNDTFPEALRIYKSLSQNIEGILYSDIEQGWQVEIAKDKDKIFFVEDGFDQGALRAAIKCDYTEVLHKVPKTIGMIDSLHREFIKILPEQVPSKYFK